MKVIPVNITERVWFNNFSNGITPDCFVYKKDSNNSFILDSPVTILQHSNYTNLFYIDYFFDEHTWYIVVFGGDVFVYKCGNAVGEFVYVLSKMQNKLCKIYDSYGVKIEDITAQYKVSASGIYVNEIDISSYSKGTYWIEIEKDFRLVEVPQVIKTASTNFLDGEIILAPGFNMIAWPGNGYGTWNNHNSSEISTVANCIASQLNEKYGVGSWRGCRTYNEIVGRFMDYLNGFTPDDAEGNFWLLDFDNGNNAVRALDIFVLSPTSLTLEFFSKK